MFATSYRESRALFRREVERLGGELQAFTVDADEDLTIDVARFNPEAKRVLVISSGLHGVEGFAGGAVQLDFLSRGWPDDIGILFLHVLNPFGMHHRRRVNESNVDLNRNFLSPEASYSGSTPAYRELDPLLNKASPPSAFEYFYLRALWAIFRKGFNALKQAIVEGQYDFPKGVFYGGASLEKSAQILQDNLPPLLDSAERMIWVDFHTGLGASGTYALLVDAPSDSDRYRLYRERFGDRVQPWEPDEGVAYTIRGGFPSALQRWFGDRIEVITCEFGTHPPLRVLRALSIENRVHHWGGDQEAAKREIMEVFCPQSPRWRQTICQAGVTVLQQAVKRLQEGA